MKKLSWKPIKKGKVYCSSACGYGCLHSDFVKATKKAAELAKKCGPKFEPLVWENGDWHYEAVYGELRVLPPKNGSKHFAATYANKFWVHTATVRDALESVRNSLEDRYNSALKDLQFVTVAVNDHGKRKETKNA